MKKVGVDVGTSLIVAAFIDDGGNQVFKSQRDAFFRIVPKSEVNRSSIKMALDKTETNYIEDGNDFVVIGEGALRTAIDRNDIARRPLRKGVISPKEKESFPMLKILLESLIGRGDDGAKLFYSVPGSPIDAHFDIDYHKEMLGIYFNELGYQAHSLNEAFAVALSELLDDGLTGVATSFGAGSTNISVIYQGDSLVEFSLAIGGDYIDQKVGEALDLSPSLIQLEKENGTDLISPKGKIGEAVAVYYGSLLRYVFKNIKKELDVRSKDLPIFREPVPIIVSGGLSLANGFVGKVEETLKAVKFPLLIKEVRRAADPMTAVASGCLLAAQL